MKFLLLFFLLLNRCAGNKKQTSSNSSIENISLETSTNKIAVNNIPNIDIQNFSCEPVFQEYIDKMNQLERENPNSLIARYDKGLDLILVQHNFKVWYIYQMYSKQDTNQFIGYTAKYWDKNNNNYYYTFCIEKTNGITYYLNNTLSHEPIFSKELRELYLISDNRLPHGLEEKNYTSSDFRYIGSISPLERVYIDISNNIQYIKRLKIVEQNYITNHFTSPIPLQSHVYPIYPYPEDIIPIAEESFLSSPIVVTNKEGEWFELGGTGFFLLNTNQLITD